MPSEASFPAETDHAEAEGALSDRAAAAAVSACPPASAGLSNDYLNHYSEVLMLIEMAGDDPAIAADLADWQPVDYRTYFGASELRRAAAALAAYDALPDESRLAFEKLVAAMDALASMAVFALQPPTDPATAPVIVDATAPALRSLIARAGAFLNSGGQMLPPDGEAGEAQLAIDRVLERAAQRVDLEIG
jgi:hypothetical protein